MSEEKKSIENLTNKVKTWKKQRPEYGNSDIVYEIDNENKSIETLLNLIEKQQEELENNKKFKKDIVDLIMLWDEEDLPENDRVIVCLDTIIHEFSRLENIEDEKIQVAVEFVEEKRDKYWKDKIRAKIKELEEEKENYFEKQVIQGRIDLLNELLEEDNND